MAVTFRKHVGEPWFTYIREGKKKYEGRIFKNEWKSIKDGDIIIFYNGGNEVPVKVTTSLLFDNFTAAFQYLDEELLPGVNDTKEANKIYKEFFPLNDIEKYGVIAVGFILL